MKIAIAGAAGRMGQWFAQYFSQNGHELYLYDIREDTVHAVAERIRGSLVKDAHQAEGSEA